MMRDYYNMAQFRESNDIDLDEDPNQQENDPFFDDEDDQVVGHAQVYFNQKYAYTFVVAFFLFEWYMDWIFGCIWDVIFLPPFFKKRSKPAINWDFPLSLSPHKYFFYF